MSSTTERMAGQALSVFTLGLTAVLLTGALAFDVGAALLERRRQQDAADAAAIAGARYVASNSTKARSAALDVAATNGFSHGVAGKTVTVNIPPASGEFQGRSDYVEVRIGSTNPSIFAGIAGIADWDVGARAVATNRQSGGGRFAILALHPTLCDAMLVAGNGSLLAYGNIQVNSSCTNGALRRQGGGNITVAVPGGACDVTGTIADGGGQGLIQCLRNVGAPVMPDPLALLPDPALPPLASPVERLSGTKATPSGCPGSANPATLASPAICQFESSYAGTTWRLYPGAYPGGLRLQGGTFYMEPGIYYMAGGGMEITGTGTHTISVAHLGTSGPAGGVMFYNTQITGSAIQSITLNGSSANIDLMPLAIGSVYDDLIIFQDRDYDINGDDVTINGSAATMDVRGTIYVPGGNVKVNGGSGTLTLDQTIAKTFVVYGSSGSQIQVLEEEEFTYKLLEAGLVE